MSQASGGEAPSPTDNGSSSAPPAGPPDGSPSGSPSNLLADDSGQPERVFPRESREESERGSETLSGTEDWTKSIKATQEVIPGTNVPKSFIIKGAYVNGNEVWVHGNATKHIGEYINFAQGSVLVENEIMRSFQLAVSQVLTGQLQTGKNFFDNIGGWEIGINSDTGVIYHARMK